MIDYLMSLHSRTQCLQHNTSWNIHMWVGTNKNQKSLHLAENSCITTIPMKNSPPPPEQLKQKKISSPGKAQCVQNVRRGEPRKLRKWKLQTIQVTSGGYSSSSDLLALDDRLSMERSKIIKVYWSQRRRNSSTDHFEEQFKWPSAAVLSGVQSTT